MRLVLELNESQISQLQSCLFAGRMEAWGTMQEYAEAGVEWRAQVWERILGRRREVADIINEAIDTQGCMGAFGEEG